jgi:hypothetical protein
MTDEPLFDPDPPTDAEAEQLRKDYEAGDFIALHEAFMRFGAHGLPLPGWVFIEVSKALEQAWVRRGGSKGQGRTGGYKARTDSALLHLVRHAVAEEHLIARGTEGGPKNRDEAFQRASVELRGKFGRGKARQISDSYDKVVRWRRKLP